MTSTDTALPLDLSKPLKEGPALRAYIDEVDGPEWSFDEWFHENAAECTNCGGRWLWTAVTAPRGVDGYVGQFCDECVDHIPQNRRWGRDPDGWKADR
jgi:hypothetical protein